jgi:two-component system response regulator YesN
MDAIAERKVEQAKKLLAENRCRIYEIAQQLGFEDTTYFSHVFRKYTGMSPKAYQDSLTH